MNLNPVNQLSLYGHHFEFCNFINLYNNKKLPNKILLSGEKGIGKSTLAYHIINRILSIDEDFKYGQVGTTRLKDLVNMNDPNFDLFYDDYIRKIQGFGPAKYEKDRSFKMGGTRHYWVPLNDFPGNG